MNISGINTKGIFDHYSIFNRDNKDDKKKGDVKNKLEEIQNQLNNRKLEDTGKAIKGVDKKQANRELHKTDGNNVSNVDSSESTQKKESSLKSEDLIVRGRKFDEFVRNKSEIDSLSSGIYSMSKDSNGNRKINFHEFKDNSKNSMNEVENQTLEEVNNIAKEKETDNKKVNNENNENNDKKVNNENNENNDKKVDEDDKDNKIEKYKIVTKSTCEKEHTHNKSCPTRVVFSGAVSGSADSSRDSIVY